MKTLCFKIRRQVLFGNVKVVNGMDAFCSGVTWNFVAPFDAVTCHAAKALMSRKEKNGLVLGLISSMD